MKAQPLKRTDGAQVFCEPSEATHIWIMTPGPFLNRFIPVQTKGTREGTGNWTWNGDAEKPTLRPSILTRGTRALTDKQIEAIYLGEKINPVPEVCHTWITNGKVQFLQDCTHEFSGQTLDLIDHETTP